MKPVDVGAGDKFPLFSLLSIEVGSRCNRECVFCPVSVGGRPDHYMPQETIDRVIAQLVDMKYSGRLEPYIYNEPLRHPRIVELIRSWRERLPRTVLGMATNGDFLKGPLLDELFAAGLNQLTINIYSTRDGHADPAVVAKGIELSKKRAAVLQAMLDERTWIDQEGSLYQRVPVKSKIARVMHKYGVQKNGANFGGGFELQNRSGNVPWLASSQPKTYSGMCTRPFRTMQINWQGNVILCCNDYHGETVYGNVTDSTLLDLWNSLSLHQWRAALQDGKRDGFCARCDYGGGAYKHNIARVTNLPGLVQIKPIQETLL